MTDFPYLSFNPVQFLLQVQLVFLQVTVVMRSNFQWSFWQGLLFKSIGKLLLQLCDPVLKKWCYMSTKNSIRTWEYEVCFYFLGYIIRSLFRVNSKIRNVARHQQAPAKLMTSPSFSAEHLHAARGKQGETSLLLYDTRNETQRPVTVRPGSLAWPAFVPVLNEQLA